MEAASPEQTLVLVMLFLSAESCEDGILRLLTNGQENKSTNDENTAGGKKLHHDYHYAHSTVSNYHYYSTNN
jgi:hypothetical protein